MPDDTDQQPHVAPTAIPAGAPSWITPELLDDTIAVWQPYYADELTADDALEILLVVGRLFENLGDAEHEKEQIPGPGSRQQP